VAVYIVRRLSRKKIELAKTEMARLPPASLNHCVAAYFERVSQLPGDPVSVPRTLSYELATEILLEYLTGHGLPLTLSSAQSSSRLSSTHRPEWPARLLALTPGGNALLKLCRIAISPESQDASASPGYRVLSLAGRRMKAQLLTRVLCSESHLSWPDDEEGSDDCFEQEPIETRTSQLQGQLNTGSPAPPPPVAEEEEEEEESP
jgi:hypothetical protein